MTDELSSKVALIERDIIGIGRDLLDLKSQVLRNAVIVDEMKKEFNTMKTDVTIIKEKMDSIIRFLWIIIGALVTIGVGILIAVVQHTFTGG